MQKWLMCVTGIFRTEGGIAAVNRLVLRSIMDTGYNVDILSLTDEPQHMANLQAGETQISPRTFCNQKVLFALATWWAILSNNYDFVFCDHANLASMLAPLSWARLCRYIVWLHGIEVFPPKPDFEGRLGLQCAWKRLSSSKYTQTRVMGRFPHLPVTACDLALDAAYDSRDLYAIPSQSWSTIEMRATDGAKHKLRGQVIMHAGRMSSEERYKGQDSLIQAFPIIYRQFPGAQLMLVGKGDDFPRLHALAKSLPQSLHSAIFMPGYVEDALLVQLFRACYLFAMPSWGEGFGLVYLEAMVNAKPCLGGRLDAAQYVIQDGVTGLIVDDPRSPEQVAEKICRLLGHPEEARRMGQAGYERVQSYYLFRHFKERFWEAIVD